MIFVFGSNKSGIHGAGSARYAFENCGAEWGKGEGVSGASYALPTKGYNIEEIPLSEVKEAVDRFIDVSHITSPTQYRVTQVGCGLGGFTKHQIAPLFKDAWANCLFDLAWYPILGDSYRYWGYFNGREMVDLQAKAGDVWSFSNGDVVEWMRDAVFDRALTNGHVKINGKHPDPDSKPPKCMAENYGVIAYPHTSATVTRSGMTIYSPDMLERLP